MHTFQYKTQDWIKNNYKEGKKVKGIVKNIKPYGAFIEIEGGVVGLAHIEDLSIARIKTPYERLQIGQKVDVVVKSIDKQFVTYLNLIIICKIIFLVQIFKPDAIVL